MEMLDKGMVHVCRTGGGHKGSIILCRKSQNLKHEWFISGIFHLVFLGHVWTRIQKPWKAQLWIMGDGCNTPVFSKFPSGCCWSVSYNKNHKGWSSHNTGCSGGNACGVSPGRMGPGECPSDTKQAHKCRWLTSWILESRPEERRGQLQFGTRRASVPHIS